MKEIKLTRGLVALIDDEDFDIVKNYRWFPKQDKKDNTIYAHTNVIINGRRRGLQMHRLILGLAPGDRRVGDHVNGNGLNNQRYNLRICSHRQNMLNRNSESGSSSIYKGVSWCNTKKRWRAQIKSGEKTFYLGYHKAEPDAALAYNQKAIELFGEFAKLNIVEAIPRVLLAEYDPTVNATIICRG